MLGAVVLSFTRFAKPHTNLRELWQLYNACICTYDSEYVRIYMYMRICTYIFSKGLSTLKINAIITAILAEWQRSSPFTVETGVRDLRTRNAFCIILKFEYLFAIEIPELPSSHVL